MASLKLAWYFLEAGVSSVVALAAGGTVEVAARGKDGGEAAADRGKGGEGDEVGGGEPGGGGVGVNVVGDLALDHGHAGHVGGWDVSKHLYSDMNPKKRKGKQNNERRAKYLVKISKPQG